jgi:hypothetical protein
MCMNIWETVNMNTATVVRTGHYLHAWNVGFVGGTHHPYDPTINEKFLGRVTCNFREKLNVDIRNTTDLPMATGKSSSRGIAATDPGMWSISYYNAISLCALY